MSGPRPIPPRRFGRYATFGLRIVAKKDRTSLNGTLKVPVSLKGPSISFSRANTSDGGLGLAVAPAACAASAGELTNVGRPRQTHMKRTSFPVAYVPGVHALDADF